MIDHASTLNLVGDPDADALLASDPLALLIGMLLDQQVPMETAFAGPKKLADRLGGLDVHGIAEADPDDFVAVCAQPPRRCTGSRSRWHSASSRCARRSSTTTTVTRPPSGRRDTRTASRC